MAASVLEHTGPGCGSRFSLQYSLPVGEGVPAAPSLGRAGDGRAISLNTSCPQDPVSP